MRPLEILNIVYCSSVVRCTAFVFASNSAEQNKHWLRCSGHKDDVQSTLEREREAAACDWNSTKTIRSESTSCANRYAHVAFGFWIIRINVGVVFVVQNDSPMHVLKFIHCVAVVYFWLLYLQHTLHFLCSFFFFRSFHTVLCCAQYNRVNFHRFVYTFFFRWHFVLMVKHYFLVFWMYF